MKNRFDTIKKIRGFSWLLPVGIGVLMFAYLAYWGKYLFCYMEQQQLFLWTTEYVSNLLFRIGGFTDLVSKFLLQFFSVSYLGAAILTLVLMTMAHAMVKVLSKHCNYKVVWIPGFIVPILLLYTQFLTDYSLQGTISYTLCMLAMWGCIYLPRNVWRHLIGATSGVLLFLLSGSAALLFVFGVFLYELLWRSRDSFFYLSALSPLLFIAGGLFAVQGGWLPEFRVAFTPDMYYDLIYTSPSLLLYSWAAFLFLLLFSWAWDRIHILHGKNSVRIVVAAQLITLVWGVQKLHAHYTTRDIMPTLELDYYVAHEQWDDVIRFYQLHQGNFVYLNSYNLALAQKGILADSMFTVQQAGPYSLLVETNNTQLVCDLLSQAALSMGDVATAQKLSYVACLASKTSVNPRQLQRMVITHLVSGEYNVAQKYLSLLHRSLFYSDWALQYSAYLNHPDRINSNPQLKELKQGMRSKSHLVTPTSLRKNLESTLMANPSSVCGLHYLGCYYLLSKDMNSMAQLLDNYARSGMLKPMPRHFQEAVCMIYENDTQRWEWYGVTPQVAQRFVEFRQTLLQYQGTAVLPQMLQNKFADTYWFYNMFAK